MKEVSEAKEEASDAEHHILHDGHESPEQSAEEGDLDEFHDAIIPCSQELVHLFPVFFCGFLEVPLRTPIVYASAFLSIELAGASPCLSSIPLHVCVHYALGICPVIAVLI